jgi:3-hydroxyisobutyrate dehydrogenase
MQIGFIGLGNVGGKLAGSLLRSGFDLTVRDLDDALVQSFVDRGATSAASPKEMAKIATGHASSLQISSDVWKKPAASRF